MSVSAFLTWEQEQEQKFELVGGRPVAMTGGTRIHGEIIGGIYAALRLALRSSSCKALIEFKLQTANGNIRYPDVMIDCGPASPKDLVAEAPKVVIEVLSESSRTTDYFTKLREYEQLASISTYLIFSQNDVRATVLRRVGKTLELEGEVTRRDAVIALPEVGVTLALADVYDGLDIGEIPAD